MYNYTVFIGRFQPPHKGHFKVIETALEKSESLIILLGSANKARSIRNPFSVSERTKMLRMGIDELGETLNSRVVIRSINDYDYNETLWNIKVQEIVHDVIVHDSKTNSPTISLIGHSKDHSSYYLKNFPNWKAIEVENYGDLSSTKIRNRFFETGVLDVKKLMDSTNSYIYNDWSMTKQCDKLCIEYELIKKIKDQWKDTPYPVIFQTVDAVVVKSGHILMVERGASPGKGMKALPGGYINEYERIADATIRELKEETKIKVPPNVLKGTAIISKRYDSPYRSERGRIITDVTLFDLDKLPDIGLPKVRGADDAAKAFWQPISELDPKECFEDHYQIIMDIISYKN